MAQACDDADGVPVTRGYGAALVAAGLLLTVAAELVPGEPNVRIGLLLALGVVLVIAGSDLLRRGRL